jgi:hypothetical protein
MMENVGYLSEQHIETDANRLRAESFGESQSAAIPVPVEDILENHLNLSLDLDDLHKLLGVPDVLGALWVRQRQVFIDESLDPCEHPNMEGRYLFSLAHEIGHWRLHRRYWTSANAVVDVAVDSGASPEVICRTSQAAKRIEWQANFYASCLLMPREHLLAAWNWRVSSSEPMRYTEPDAQLFIPTPGFSGAQAVPDFLRSSVEGQYAPNTGVFEYVVRDLAAMFHVSRKAMRIRLERLGLDRCDIPAVRSSFGLA